MNTTTTEHRPSPRPVKREVAPSTLLELQVALQSALTMPRDKFNLHVEIQVM